MSINLSTNETFAPVPTNADMTNVYTIFNWISDTATKGLFWVATIWAMWVVILIGNLSEGKSLPRSLVYCNFVSAILGGILTLLGWISQTWTWFFVVMLALSLLWLKASE
jgi:hypothetical protein